MRELRLQLRPGFSHVRERQDRIVCRTGHYVAQKGKCQLRILHAREWDAFVWLHIEHDFKGEQVSVYQAENRYAWLARGPEFVVCDADAVLAKSGGLTFEACARAEFQRGFTHESSEALAAARTEYEKLGAGPVREQLLSNLDARVKSQASWTGIPNAPTRLLALPREAREALSQLAPEEIGWLIENDIAETQVVSDGTNAKESRADRDRYAHLVSLGMLTWIPEQELRRIERRSKRRYDDGVNVTPLFGMTRDFLLSSAVEAAHLQ